MIYLDTETCGLVGQPVLIQYAEDDGPIVLYDIWKRPIRETLALIEWFMGETIVGFNLSFDMFQLVKCYTTFRLADPDWIPEEHIDEIALLEPEAQSGPCLKPASACDLLLHSRKNEYQKLMARETIRIRRVPTVLAHALAEELEGRVELDGILFARFKDKNAPKWRVYDIRRPDGTINPDFKDVVLRFAAAGGLKFLAEYALKREPKYHFKDVEVSPEFYPIELGYAPTALALSTSEDNWEIREEGKLVGHAWPGVIRHHIEHWANNAEAREYANDDIVYTRDLYDHFKRPEPGDDDSILACMVPVVRWRGYSIDIEGVKGLMDTAQQVVAASPVNINNPREVRKYLMECLNETEALLIEESTKKQLLEEMQDWEVDWSEEEELATWQVEDKESCTKCLGDGCLRCGGRGHLVAGMHPAAIRAKEILTVKFAMKEVELYQKLLKAGKFHAEFNVIGALSSRMSGGGGLNAQGIKKTKEVRAVFPLANEGYVLTLGDFSSFEITLMDAVYQDPTLRTEIMSGVKVHGTFGTMIYPGTTYQEILDSEGTDNDLYSRSKQGVFAMGYGGNAFTLKKKLNVPMDIAEAAYIRWGQKFPGIGASRERVSKQFSALVQPVPGGQVFWNEPQDYCETFLGFRRYFSLENTIIRALFELAQRPPKEWRAFKIKVQRKADREQTAFGAVQSALFGAAFQIQAANIRAAANHEIQSPGAQITKKLQRRIWDLQPVGIHDLLVQPANIHDEVIAPARPHMVEAILEVVREVVDGYRPQVPLIGMEYGEAATWAEKKTVGGRSIKVTYDKSKILAA